MAFRRRMRALQLPNADSFSCDGVAERDAVLIPASFLTAAPAASSIKDESPFRHLIVTLEDTKIRHYKIEERGELRNVGSEAWPSAFEKV